MGRVLGEIEERQDVLAHVRARGLVGQALSDSLHFELDLGRLGRERILVDRAGQISVQQPLLYLFELRQAFACQAVLFLAHTGLIVARDGQVATEPIATLVVRDAQHRQIVRNGLLESIFAPAHGRVVWAGFEIAAAVIDVLVDPAALHPAHDSLAGDSEAAVRADKHSAGEIVIGVAHATVLAVEQVLAALEDIQFDDRLVLAWECLPPERDHTDVEAVVQNVRQRRAVEARVTRLVRVALSLEHTSDVTERVEARLVQLEDSLHGQSVHRVRLDRFVAIAAHILVAVRREPGSPALADLLLDALQDFVPQVVRIVLRHGGHHIERQRAGRTRAELVVHERELHAAGIFELLHSHRVAHVAADAIKLVGQDELDLELADVRADPLQHLVEDQALRATFGGFGHDELADDGPALLFRPLAGNAQLRVDGVALALLPRRDPRPDHGVLHQRFLLAWTSTSARLLTFIRISIASASFSDRPKYGDHTRCVSAIASSVIQAAPGGRRGGAAG